MVYKLQTGINKAKRKVSAIAFGVAALSFPAIIALSGGAASAAVSNNYSFFGDASLVQPGNASANAAQATSSSTGAGYGGVNYADPSGITVSQLNNLSTDYQMTAGSCGGGSPRFVINVNGNDNTNISVYLGTPPNYTTCATTWTNTGNLLTPTSLVDTSQLPGGTFYDTYAHAQTLFGSYNITGLSFVVDGSWSVGTQTAQVDNTQFNDTTYTYEPAPTKDSCKNGGWKTMDDGTKSFKNQGDCVSFFATNGRNPANGLQF